MKRHPITNPVIGSRFAHTSLAAVALIALATTTPAYAQVCGDLTCSATENCVNCALDCVAWLGCNVNASDVVTVDFAAEAGPVTYRASGFIGADFSSTDPPDALYLPVKPQLLSWQTGYSALARARGGGTGYEIKLWDKSAIPSSVTGDWSTWESRVRSRVRAANLDPLVRFDIWNEPEFSTYWDGPIDHRYFEMWRRAYAVIRAEAPNALIVGPSTTNLTWLKGTFVPMVQTMNALPDVLSWHEMDSGANVRSHVQDLRSYLQVNGIAIDRFSINEYMGSAYAWYPGIAVRFFSQLEEAQVFSAARACWEEVVGGSYECAPHFDNLVTMDREKRSLWWTYKSYAEMTGNLVPLVGTSRVSGLASSDSTVRTGRVLLGSVASTGPVELRLLNVDRSPFYSPAGRVRVVLHRIPNTGTGTLAAPTEEIDLEFAVNANTVRILIGNFGLYDAFEAWLSVTGSGDIDADDDGWPVADDCDDGDPAVHPGAVEVLGDGIDNNCNGLIDEPLPPTSSPQEAWIVAADSDVGTLVRLEYDPACGAAEHAVYWGTSPIQGALAWTGSACAFGPEPILVDLGTPLPGRFAYFVVVGYTDEREGTYGLDSSTAQRPDAVGVGLCDRALAIGGVCP